MKIKTRVLVLIGLALAGLIIVAAIGINNSNSNSEIIAALNENRIPRTIAMLEISGMVNDEVRRSYEILSKNDLSLNEQIQELRRILPLKQATDKALRDNLDIYEKLDRSAKATELFNKAKETMAGWQPIAVEGNTRLLEEALANPTAENLARMHERVLEGNLRIRDKTPLLIEQINEMVSHNSMRTNEESAKSRIASRNALLLQIGIGLALIAGIAFLGFSTLKSVVKPIETVRDTTVKIAGENDLRIRVDYRANDEVGEMVEAFNGMLGKLQT
ncbi:MAG: HAMP domain-containing protein, partial [Zoogloeaceae bacterium]|nr:HAMP domain-containing protein [Zoogloeaceae bacterium]